APSTTKSRLFISACSDACRFLRSNSACDRIERSEVLKSWQARNRNSLVMRSVSNAIPESIRHELGAAPRKTRRSIESNISASVVAGLQEHRHSEGRQYSCEDQPSL